MKAQRRMKIPGRKKAREAMTVVSEQEPWTPCLRWGTIYGIPVVPLRRDPRACWVDALTIPRLPYVTTPPCSFLLGSNGVLWWCNCHVSAARVAAGPFATILTVTVVARGVEYNTRRS
jgi:hypothetical protein